ncbi:hypothetical protein XENTR_v10010549 [Xenopus tropicalis]|nr:hypothetical protein XENTR_v10010549 [Xenopus tropicalis]
MEGNMAANEDYQSLVEGVGSLDFTGEADPCKLLLTGDCAFPVLVSPRQDVLIAASRYGKGKMVVMAHWRYLNRHEFKGFLNNTVCWLSPDSEANVGVHNTLKALARILSESGYKVHTTSTLTQGLSVFCTDGYDDQQAEEIISFVREGGGLLIGAQAWDWANNHKEDNVLHHFPGNKIVSVCGVHFTSDYGEKGDFCVTKNMPQAPINSNYNFSAEQKSLLNGVSQLDISGPSVPSDLLLHGALSFPVGLSEGNQCFVGAVYYGKGRVVVVTHESYLTKPELKQLILNAISWLDIGHQRRIAVHDNLRNFAKVLQKENIPCIKVSGIVPKLSVYCCDSYRDTEAKGIHQFVAEGGGLLIAGHAWWWSYQNPTLDALTHYPGNKILNQFGISILASTVPRGIYRAIVPGEATEQYHFLRALRQLEAELQKVTELPPPFCTRVTKLMRDVTAFLRLPASPIIRSIQSQLVEMIKTYIPNASEMWPISNCSKEDLLLRLAHESYNVTHVCDESNILETEPSITVNIDATNPGGDAWRSTGLYLAPRKAAVLEFPVSVVQQGFWVQVGCQTDDLSDKEKLHRAPVVVRKIHVDCQKVAVSSLWGGLLYIIVRADSKLGPIPVRVYGAEPAPVYIKGQTSPDSWLHSVRKLPAPWAELVTENIILTVPSDAVRSLTDPESLLSYWDRIMGAIAELAAIETFPRPERFVADVQISAGWMHAGYPIMCHVESVRELTDLAHMQTEGMWGPIHELGRNQQRKEWGFPPHTTEATCNLWSVYVHETALGIRRDQAHPDLQPDARRSRIKAYLQGGLKLKNWDSWTELETYLQLQEGFGWKPFKSLFGQYQDFSSISDKNKSKMNLWAEEFSWAVETNLVPFFEAWGWPIDPETRSSVSAFPVWESDPMKPYLTAQKP